MKTIKNRHDILIDRIFWKENKLMNAHKRSKIFKLYNNIFSYLNCRYGDSLSIKETLFRIHFNVEEHPKCKYCNNLTKFIGRINKPLFQEYCSNSCAAKSTNRGHIWYENQKKHNEQKYGIGCNFYIPNININESREKIKNTCITKYGVTSNLGIKEINRGKYFCNSKFIQKSKQTCIEKYGVDNYSKTKEFKDLIKIKKEEIKQKSKETCLRKYGVDNYIKTKEFKEKSLESKLKNHTFNSSKPEEELFLYIKERFPSVKRQYKEQRYPFACDFYIPELDLFLELNGTWTHGKHPYNSFSPEDKFVLNEWKEKSKEHPFYNNAVKTWTIYDVNKRNIAKKNNLNFKEVWALQEGKEFIDKIYAKREIPY